MSHLCDHAYQLARAYPGGITALAGRIGKNPTTLTHELSGQGSAKLGLEDAASLTAMSGDLRILEAWAAEHALVLLPMPEQPDTPPQAQDSAFRLAHLAKEFGAMVQEVAGGLEDARITDNELKSITNQSVELIASIHAVLASMRAVNAAGKVRK